jgi:dTMP kinase
MTYDKFVIFEGIDGSGKRTLAKVFADILKERGHSVLDLVDLWRRTNHIPLAERIEEDVIISAEPTFAGVGLAVRNDLIRKGQGYDALSISHGYALDRMILYKRLILPALAAGKFVLQERGVPSSLVYQPIQNNPLSLEEVMNIPGNKFTIENAPGHLVIAKVSAKTAMGRLGSRVGKDDNAIFEKESFLAKAEERYGSDWFKKFWEERGTKVRYLDAERPLETVKSDAIRLANEIFPA